MTPALLYQDDDLIAVDKPEGLASNPEHDREKENLQTNENLTLLGQDKACLS